jgi:hypothetical protein
VTPVSRETQVWLGYHNKPGEFTVAYHGVRSLQPDTIPTTVITTVRQGIRSAEVDACGSTGNHMNPAVWCEQVQSVGDIVFGSPYLDVHERAVPAMCAPLQTQSSAVL